MKLETKLELMHMSGILIGISEAITYQGAHVDNASQMLSEIAERLKDVVGYETREETDIM